MSENKLLSSTQSDVTAERRLLEGDERPSFACGGAGGEEAPLATATCWDDVEKYVSSSNILYLLEITIFFPLAEFRLLFWICHCFRLSSLVLPVLQKRYGSLRGKEARFDRLWSPYAYRGGKILSYWL